jgi:hypothetical protein
MNVTQKEGVKTLSIPSTLHKILNSLSDVDNKVTFEDIQPKPFSLKTFPSDKAQFNQAFGTVIKDGRSTQVILGFTIKSSNTLGALNKLFCPSSSAAVLSCVPIPLKNVLILLPSVIYTLFVLLSPTPRSSSKR